MKIIDVILPAEKARISRAVLDALPGHFGNEQAKEGFILNGQGMPMFAAVDGDMPLGFLSLKVNFPETVEIYCMGVMPDMHRRGIGRALITRAEEEGRALHAKLMEVKTLDFTDPDPGYARTRAFYLAMGFLPFDSLLELWDEDNPCLIMAKLL